MSEALLYGEIVNEYVELCKRILRLPVTTMIFMIALFIKAICRDQFI